MTASPSHRRSLVQAGLVLAVAVAAYLPSFRGAFYLDDYANILITDHIDSLSLSEIGDALAGAENPSRPLANLTFLLDYHWHRDAVFGYHLVNLLLHLGCAIMLWLIFARLLRPRFDPRDGSWLATAGALVWAVHPVTPQTVTYIVQRMTIMATLFFLIGVYAYLRERDATGRRRHAWTAVLIAGYALGILSKEIAVVLPVVLAVHALLFRDDDRRRARHRLVALALLTGLGIATVVYATGGLGEAPRLLGGGYGIRSFSLSERLLTQPRVIFDYLGLTFLPTPGRLMLTHGVAHSTGLLSPPTTLPAILGLLAILAAGALLVRRRPLAAFGLAWAVITTLPESSIVPLELMYEHRMYLPLPGILLFVACWVWPLVERDRVRRRLAAAAVALIVAVFATMTFARNALYADRVAFLEDNAGKTPGDARIHTNLGRAYLEANRADDALAEYRRAIELAPDEITPSVGMAYALVAQGREHEAIAALQRFRDEPELPAGYFHAYGKALYFAGDNDAARQLLTTAVELEPNLPDANLGLAAIEIETGNFASAISHLERERAITGDGATYHFYLGTIDELRGRPRRAIEHFREATVVAGDDSYRRRARDRLRALGIGSPDHEE